MDKPEIIRVLKGILVDDLFVADSPDDIDVEVSLDNDLGLDSVGFVELGTLVSETFNIRIADSDVGEGHFASVNRLADFIISRLGTQAAAE